MLRLSILGGFEARVGEDSVLDLSYAKLRGLLVFLAMSNGIPVKREYLADLFWPEMSAAASRQNLRRALFNLKTTMGATGQLLAANREAVSLAHPDSATGIWLDAAEFTSALPSCLVDHPAPDHCQSCLVQMEYQAKHYRGEFLAGFSLPDCPEFEGWLQLKREELHRRALALLEKLSNCCEQVNDYVKALQFSLRHTELEPWNEDGHRRLMRLYALNGQNSAAIAQYETCCRLIKEELGALPSEETRQLAEGIRNGKLQRETFDRLRTKRIHDAIPQIHAERKQVTVLYCELSTAADEPDEAMELLHAPQARCVEIIRQFSGHIVQTHGGGLLAYFGYPQADEFAARHAVQAALAVTRLAGGNIEIRAGVHTGLIITSGDQSIPDTVGITSRLAIQLRQCAAPNEVAISQETLRIVTGYFDVANLAARPLPDLAQAVEVVRVLQETDARTRLDAAMRLTPLVGRETELAKLLGLWESSKCGKQNVVLVQGEGGIGKTRLVHTLKEHLAAQPHAVRELRCFMEFRQTPFHPVIAMLDAIFGFNHDDLAEQKSGKLAQYLDAHFPALAREAVPLLTKLLALSPTGDHTEPALSPQQRKERTIVVLLELLQALATQQPVLLIVEDLHWADPSTLELLTQFVEQRRKAPVLALLTARPEFDPSWDESFDTTLALEPLSKENIEEMVASINHALPDPTVRRIVERTDGVPLFVEEMVQLATTSDKTTIPASLHDLLAARLDNMGNAKYLAQLAATIGREFDVDLLGKISASDTSAVSQGLLALQDAGLIFKANETTRQFKHALIQEAAYQSMTKAIRQAAHNRIAHVLLSDFPEIATTRPELLAQHLAAAGETLLAVEYWLMAGQRAAQNSANAEAIGHFNCGLELLMLLPLSQERDRLESTQQLNLGIAFIAAKGYGSFEAGQAYIRALELCERLSDSTGMYQALWGMWLTSSSRVGHAHSLELAGKLLRLAEQTHDVLQLQSAHHAMGNSSLITGNLLAAHFHLEQSMSHYQPPHHEAMVSQFGENTFVSSGSLLSLALWLQGFPNQADEVSKRTLAFARQLNHPQSSAYALCAAAILYRWMGQIETTGQLAQEAMALSHKHGMPFWLGMGTTSYGWVQATKGQASGPAQIQQCMGAINAIMSGSTILFLAPLCEALVCLGRFEDALDKLDEALNVARERDDRFLESEFYRLKGVCLLAISATHSPAAEACFNQALKVSKKQGAKSLELRVAICLARLWWQQGKQEDARLVLKKIYDWFTEGFDMNELQEARRLLDSLS